MASGSTCPGLVRVWQFVGFFLRRMVTAGPFAHFCDGDWGRQGGENSESSIPFAKKGKGRGGGLSFFLSLRSLTYTQGMKLKLRRGEQPLPPC